MKILFLSRWFPSPPDNGSKIRVLHLLDGLAQVHQVDLISFSDRPEVDAAAAEAYAAESGCRSVKVVPWKNFDPGSRRAALGLFTLQPRSVLDTYSPVMEAEIRTALAAQDYDLVITSQWQMNAYRKCFARTPTLMEEIEVGVTHGHFADAHSAPAKLRSGLTWLKHRAYLAGLLDGSQPCTVVSAEEKQLLLKIVPEHTAIHVIPNGLQLRDYLRYDEEPEPNSLIFTGSFRYRPNYEAMVWFIEQVYPRIRAEIPDVHLRITGDHAQLPLPNYDGVTLTGYVDDVRTLIRRSWVSLAPLLTGGGTRLKILEAMALRTPVVSTSKGVEGLDAVAGSQILTADAPEKFAQETIRLLRDRDLRAKIAANGFEVVRCKYDWQIIMPAFLEIVEQAADSRKIGVPRATV